MKIAICGVTGFIGSSLCEKFLQMGYQVIGIGRKENDRIKNFNKNNFKFIKINDLKETSLKDIDIFYDLAWNMSFANTKDNVKAYETEIENLEMTCNIVNYAIKSKVKKIVFCGSINQNKYYFNENRNFNDIKGSIYGITKQAASDICQKMAYDANIDYNHALLTNTYGPNDYNNKAVSFFIKKMQNNEELNLISENDPADWVYIDDTVNALIAVGEKGKNMKTYYLGHKKIQTFKENILALKKVLNSNSKLNFGVYKEYVGSNYYNIDLNSLYNDTGFECQCDFKESILKTQEWLNKNCNEIK